jgi:DNA (cytosine-5)-methyltransferase 1
MKAAASLFAGIGALDLALRRCGVEVDVQVELDPEARAVLARHWPGATRHADVRGLSLGPVDVVVGGFPCTGTSRAGKRAGLEHAESGLWAEYARIVRESEPRLVLIENPSSLLYPGRGFDVVAHDLLALGYAIRWDCVPASAVGAPHERDRVWIVATRDAEALDLLRIPARSDPWAGGYDGPIGAVSTPDVRRRLRQLGLAAVPEAALEGLRVADGPATPIVWPRPDRWPRAGRWWPGEAPIAVEPRYPRQRAADPTPTPTAGDAKASRRLGYPGQGRNTTLTDYVRQREPAARVADPQWVEWLMGLPAAWSERQGDTGAGTG